MNTIGVIGAIHFLPLIGYGNYPEDEIYAAALQDLDSLQVGGVNAIIFENNYAIPHRIIVESETVAMMTRLINKLRKDTKSTVWHISVLERLQGSANDRQSNRRFVHTRARLRRPCHDELWRGNR